MVSSDTELLDSVQRAAGLPGISRVVRSRGAVPYFDGSMVVRGGAAIAWTNLAADETQRGSVPHPMVHMILEGRVTYRVGQRTEVVGTTGDLVFVPNGVNLTLVREPGRYCNWLVPAASLAAALAAPQRADGSHFVVPLTRISATVEERRELEDLLDQYARSFDRAGPPESQPVAAWLARVLERSARIVRLAPSSVARLARLDAWLDDHLHEQVTLPDLCAVAGCGQRALQKLVAARHGLSPMGYVRERRLAFVREKLAGERESRVTEVALDAGLNHLGRLAQAYRTLFGESPVDTRRKRDGGDGERAPLPLRSPGRA